MTIEGAWGLGSAVVGGEVTPDRWVVGKITGEISVREISDKQIQHCAGAGGGVDDVPVPEALRRAPCLSDEELQAAARASAARSSATTAAPQDIEWAIDRQRRDPAAAEPAGNRLVGKRSGAGRDAPAADPLLHVMSIFGGRR